jgi:hypothetical protein
VNELEEALQAVRDFEVEIRSKDTTTFEATIAYERMEQLSAKVEIARIVSERGEKWKPRN